MDSNGCYGHKKYVIDELEALKNTRKLPHGRNTANAKKCLWDELVIQFLLIVAVQDKEATMC